MFFEKHRVLIIVVSITVLLVVGAGLSTLDTGSAFVVDNVVLSVIQPVQSGIAYVTNGVGNFFNFIFEMKDYKAENDRLAVRLAEMERKYRSAEEYRLENERLTELLDLKVKALSEFPSVAARVVAWSSNNWYNYYTIDKGTIHGIKKKDMVVTEAGLVGYVDDVGLNWAHVITVINESSAVGVRVIRNGDLGIVEGDFELEKSGMCKMNLFNKEAQVAIGDILETSGLGGIYAAGVSIGKVVEIQSDVTGVSQNAIIEPLVDLKNINVVIVISSDTWREE